MANLLKNLEVSCVSLVDRAAVRDPSNPTQPQRLLLWKREDPPAPGGDHMTKDELTELLSKSDLPQEVKDSLLKAEERDAALAKATEDLAKQSTDMAALTAKVADLEKAASSAGADDDDEDDLQKALAKSDLPENVRNALLKADADRKAIEKSAAERIEKAEKDAKTAQDLAKAEQDARLTAEFVQKAETYKALPVEAAKFGPVLKSAAEKLTKEEAAELDRVLKAADAQITAGEVFKQQGRDGQPPAPAADSALAKAQAKAVELQKADPKLSESEALDKAMKGDRELQAAYLAEVRGG